MAEKVMQAEVGLPKPEWLDGQVHELDPRETLAPLSDIRMRTLPGRLRL